MTNEIRSAVVGEAELKSFCKRLLQKTGVSELDAGIVTENLIEADLRGVDSHGVVRLPIYIRRLLDGGTNKAPRVHTTRETATTLTIDGDNGLGHLVGVRAMESLIDKALRGNCCAFAAVRNSNHFGAAAYYGEMAARAGMIGFAFTIGAINHMTPWGGAEAVLGNNPFAIVMPTPEPFPYVLDMACSVAARGKIIVAAKEGKPIPADWATDEHGVPTTDAAAALAGFVLPVGGPKGYALTLTVGLLSTMLSGAAFGRDVGDLYDRTKEAQDSGHLFGVLPIDLFDSKENYMGRFAKAIADVRGARKAPGVDRIYLPGEREYLFSLKRRRDGIPLGPALARELQDLGREHGLTLEVSH
jgi:LDH2 family malate/lactate/ureidoglycolate dehydrogenase